jgi:RNA 2',3'-cyclic 3'-phosphodiesterase
MRLFVALDIDDGIRDRIARFLDGVRGFAQEARWVRPESLHVTLKFIGEKSDDEADKIRRALQMIMADGFRMNIRGCGFFPGTRAPRVFWIGVEADAKLAFLATTVDGRLAALNIPKEENAFNPHLTLARGAGASTARSKHKARREQSGSLRQLQERLAALSAPEFGTMTAREFFLYQSQLSPGGSKYTKLAGFPLH